MRLHSLNLCSFNLTDDSITHDAVDDFSHFLDESGGGVALVLQVVAVGGQRRHAGGHLCTESRGSVCPDGGW